MNFAEQKRINPQESAITNVLEKMVQGRRIYAQIDGWRIDNTFPDQPNSIALYYRGETAVYGFDLSTSDDGTLTFFNFHREAVRGNGTPTLQHLERSFSLLARRMKKDVRLMFPLFGQEDTHVWLEKNGYVSDHPEHDLLWRRYYKIIPAVSQ